MSLFVGLFAFAAPSSSSTSAARHPLVGSGQALTARAGSDPSFILFIVASVEALGLRRHGVGRLAPCSPFHHTPWNLASTTFGRQLWRRSVPPGAVWWWIFDGEPGGGGFVDSFGGFGHISTWLGGPDTAVRGLGIRCPVRVRGPGSVGPAGPAIALGNQAMNTRFKKWA